MEAYETIIKKLKELKAVKNPTKEQKMELEVLRYQEGILKDALELEREQFNREREASTIEGVIRQNTDNPLENQ